MSKTTAIVVTHNNSVHIERCIKSLRGEVCEVIVVDSGSTDDTSIKVRAMGVRVIEVGENIGFAAASNVGARQAKSPYVFFLNPDAWIVAGRLSKAESYLDAHQDVAIAGFLLEDKNGSPEHYGYGASTSFLSLLKKVPITHKRLDPVCVGWVSGGAMVVRSTDLIELNGFDEAFFMYWEDVDLCRRAQYVGRRVVHFPLITIRHERGGSSSGETTKTYQYDRSADKYFRKHYHTPIWLLQWILRRIYRLFYSQAR